MDPAQPAIGLSEQVNSSENAINVVGDSPISSTDVDPFLENLNRDPNLRHEARGLSENGVPIASVMISPQQERWAQVYENVSSEMQRFMETVVAEPEEERFPFNIGGSNQFRPPYPSADFMGNWYERVKSCNDPETHLEHVSNDAEYRGCERINDNYYRLANKSVAVISQLQNYPTRTEDVKAWKKFKEKEIELFILANKLPILVGLLALLIRLKRADVQYTNLQTYRQQSVLEHQRNDMLYPNANPYRHLCLKTLQVYIINLIIPIPENIFHEDGSLNIVFMGDVYQDSLWASEYFKIMVWDAMADVAILANRNFYPSLYPFIEHCTSNIARDNPTFRKNFEAQGMLEDSLLHPQGLKCLGIWDMDRHALTRQLGIDFSVHDNYKKLMYKYRNTTIHISCFTIRTARLMLGRAEVNAQDVDVPLHSKDVIRHQEFLWALTTRRDAQQQEDVSLTTTTTNMEQAIHAHNETQRNENEYVPRLTRTRTRSSSTTPQKRSKSKQRIDYSRGG